jgi:hypothetical protein
MSKGTKGGNRQTLDPQVEARLAELKATLVPLSTLRTHAGFVQWPAALFPGNAAVISSNLRRTH